jgi:uncharacterized protein (TIGR02001 family)
MIINKKLLLGSVLAASMSGLAVQASADVSGNVGFASEYYYRGILQKDSSASAGLDYENGGFSLGTWAADVGDGLEVDLYGGYGIETESGFSLGLGFTGYYYTGEFDDTYEEINFSAGYGPVSVGYSVGEYDNFDGPSQDYDFTEITFEHEGFFATYGTFGDDFDGDYIELGYGTEVGGFDLGVTTIFSSDELSDEADSEGNPEQSEAIIFTIGKSFDL